MADPLYSTETIVLPSRGVLYGDAIPEGKVTIRNLTTQEEKLLSSSKASAGNAFDKIISLCVVSPKVDTDILLSTDKFFIFMALRWITYGPTYKFDIQCSDCRFSFNHQVNLTEFTIKNLDDTVKEPFAVKLPKANVTVGLRLLRGGDERAIKDYETQKLRHNPDGGDGYIYRIARSIVSVDNTAISIQNALAFVERLHGLDSSVIQNELEKYDSGIVPAIEADCPRCSNHMSMLMPLTPEFFRARN